MPKQQSTMMSGKHGKIQLLASWRTVSLVCCRQAECFVQVVNLLNFDYEGGHGAFLCEEVLATLTALVAGNEGARRRLVCDVGYDQILTAIEHQVFPFGQFGAQRCWVC
jgi:hypothetical protein